EPADVRADDDHPRLGLARPDRRPRLERGHSGDAAAVARGGRQPGRPVHLRHPRHRPRRPRPPRPGAGGVAHRRRGGLQPRGRGV
ncbi:MAG: hypothetical protein AVDCRST_MAG15-3309, partial [uncultured Rubellimicrobium sp.]